MRTGGIAVCAAGYFAVTLDDEQAGYRLLENEQQLFDFLEKYDRFFINIPVGLQDDEVERECDKLLRERLGPFDKDEVINPPIRGIILAPTYGEASMISYEIMEKRLPMQSWNMVPHIRAIVNFIQKNESFRSQLFESHPELLFQILNGGPILQKKATKKGLRHRLHLLEAQNKYVDDFFRDSKETFRRNQVEEDKIIDAMALALFALRSIDEPIKTLPADPPDDSLGLPMAIHYV